MPSPVCSQCGAELTMPADPSVVIVRCAYCKKEHRASDLASGNAGSPEILRTLRDVATAQRSLFIIFGVGTIAMAAALYFVVRTLPSGALEQVSRPPPPVTAPVLTPHPPAPPSAAPSSAPLPAGPPILRQFGTKGTGPGQFDRARRLAVDRDGNVFVADLTGRVQRFDGEGRLVSSLRAETRNRQRGPLSSDITDVLGLAADRKGNLYVAIGYDILRFAIADGKLTATFRGRPDVTCYRDLTVDQSDRIVARSACSDAHRHAVVVLGSSGNVIARRDEPNTYEKAATGKVGVDAGGMLYVPHGVEHEVQVYTPRGELYTRFGRKGDGPGEFETSFVGPVVVDAAGNLYVRDGVAPIERFDPKGASLGVLDLRATGHVTDLAFGPRGTLFAIISEERVVELDVAPSSSR